MQKMCRQNFVMQQVISRLQPDFEVTTQWRLSARYIYFFEECIYINIKHMQIITIIKTGKQNHSFHCNWGKFLKMQPRAC